MKRSFVSFLVAIGLVVGSQFAAPYAQAQPSSPAGVKLGKPLKGVQLGGKVSKGDPSDTITALTVNCGAPTCYKYAGARDTGITGADGAQITMKVAKPNLLTYDWHSLGELAVQNSSGNTVETGWNVDPTTNGDSNPHLYVFYRVGGTPGGYNTNFVPVASPVITPGASLLSAVGTNIVLKWQYFGTGCGCTQGWWLSYGGTLIGLFPATLWSGAYTTPTLVQAFGELSLGYTPSQTKMGDGTIATSTTGATMGGYTLTGSSPSAPIWDATFADDPDRWPVVQTSNTAFHYGGPGGTETINGSVTADNCFGVGVGTNPSGQGSFCAYNTNPGLVPTGKVTQIDGSATTACRGNIGTADGVLTTPISNVAISAYKKVIWFRDNACAGASMTFNHGTVTLPAGWTNLAHASYIVSSTYATCATGYPTTPPTC